MKIIRNFIHSVKSGEAKTKIGKTSNLFPLFPLIVVVDSHFFFPIDSPTRPIKISPNPRRRKNQEKPPRIQESKKKRVPNPNKVKMSPQTEQRKPALLGPKITDRLLQLGRYMNSVVSMPYQ